MAGADVYFWRQMLVLLADCLSLFGVGVMLAFPSVLNPAILSPNSTDIKATPDQASWIAAIHGFSGVIGFCLIPPLMQAYGRKLVHVILSAALSIGFLIFYFAQSITILVVARIVQGVSMAGVYLLCVIASEYCPPERRGSFTAAMKCSVASGSLLCHTLTLCWTWRQISAFSFLPTTLAIITVLFRPESPSYLAMKGRFEECGKAFTWLHGSSPQSNKKLEDLISSQVERMNRKVANQKTFIKLCKKFARKDFLKPFVIVCLLTIIVDACGRFYTIAYIINIFTEITGDNSIAIYCSIGTDLIAILGLVLSGFTSQYFNRRTILFVFGSIAVLLMFLASSVIVVQSKGFVSSILPWVTLIIILTHTFIVNTGVIPICFVLSGEIFPLEHKGLGLFSTGIVFTLLYAAVLKCTPIMLSETGVEGTYSIYAVCVVVCLLLLRFILPETKDKTLQEIEDEIRGKRKPETPLLQTST